MQQRTRILAAFTLSAAMTCGTAAIAAGLPKEGTDSDTYTGFGTVKGSPIGKDRWLGSWEENGLTIGTGYTDHITWHCFGLTDISNGMAQDHGYCVGTDPDGDKIAADVGSDGKYAVAKSNGTSVTYTTGTGKYAGISGGYKYVCHSGEFRPAAEGTYHHYCSGQGSYKLP
jgi:hypothetical protein